jgi:hypothetical protein
LRLGWLELRVSASCQTGEEPHADRHAPTDQAKVRALPAGRRLRGFRREASTTSSEPSPPSSALPPPCVRAPAPEGRARRESRRPARGPSDAATSVSTPAQGAPVTAHLPRVNTAARAVSAGFKTWRLGASTASHFEERAAGHLCPVRRGGAPAPRRTPGRAMACAMSSRSSRRPP